MNASTIRLILLLAVSILATTLLSGCARASSHRLADSSGATFAEAAVATDHPIASDAGARMLALGGNSVDAAVAASFTLSVVRPYSCGIGGGGFMLIHLPNDPSHGFVSTTINYRETTPGAVGPDFYEQLPDDASTVGATAVGVPGTVAGLLHALDSYGMLPREVVLAPAIEAAEQGFVVDEHYAGAARARIEWFENDPSRKTRFPFLWERFLGAGSIDVGDRIVNPEQARALRLISDDGIAAFYSGPIGEAIVARVRSDGGSIDGPDLRGYEVRTGPPLVGSWGQRSVLAFSPPSSGGVAILQVMRSLNHLGWPTGDPGLDAHLYVEASKHAFADRARYMADPAFAPVPVGPLLDPAMLDTRAASIRRGATSTSDTYGSGVQLPEDGGTSHISVVDSFGGAVACTETINLLFGSQLDVPQFGFCLNNEMDDFLTRRGTSNAFGLTQSERNLPEPGKRPLSSMSPTIVLDGADVRSASVYAVAGASGGPRIISGTLQALLGTSDAPDALSSVSRPRIHHQWSPDVVFVEPEVPAEIRDGLTERGHELRERVEIGVVQLIVRVDRNGRAHYSAASDPRKGGRPAGLD